MKKLFLDFGNEAERKPLRAFLFMIATNFGIFFLFVFETTNWPDYATKIMGIGSWFWLAWMIYVAAPMIRYIMKIGKY